MNLGFLLLGLIGIFCMIMAITSRNNEKSFILGLLALCLLSISALGGYFCKDQPKKVISTFVEDHAQYLSPTTIRTISTTPIRELPDGCLVYSVILIDQDSTYTYSAVLDPEETEVVNFILEESIPRLENYQNK